MTDPQLDPRFLAGVKLLERTGARFRIDCSDDGEPVAWYAVATWQTIDATGNVHASGAAEAARAMNPVDAVLRLCERVIDGGDATLAALVDRAVRSSGELAS